MGLKKLPRASILGKLQLCSPSLVSARRDQFLARLASLKREPKVRKAGKLFRSGSVLMLGGVQEGPVEKPWWKSVRRRKKRYLEVGKSQRLKQH